MYGVPKDLTESWALGDHLLSVIPVTIVGAVYFVYLGLNEREFTRARRGRGPA